MILLHPDGPRAQTLHELTHVLRQLTSSLGRQPRPQAWRHLRRLRSAPQISDRGLARRLRGPHLWTRAQRGRDSL